MEGAEVCFRCGQAVVKQKEVKNGLSRGCVTSRLLGDGVGQTRTLTLALLRRLDRAVGKFEQVGSCLHRDSEIKHKTTHHADWTVGRENAQAVRLTADCAMVFGVWCLVFGVWCLVFGVGGVGGARQQEEEAIAKHGVGIRTNFPRSRVGASKMLGLDAACPARAAHLIRAASIASLANVTKLVGPSGFEQVVFRSLGKKKRKWNPGA
eukprot:1330192-Rhodomonas_salina.4